MSNVVVRFAPSPTGHLHIGNVRTAVLNYLFMKKAGGGTFILRMDDTDAERSTEEYANGIERDLTWLGISWDRKEYQSKRLERYNQVTEDLKKRGLLYPCYETPEELEYKRNRQRAKKQAPIYDRAALSLPDEQKKKYEQEGRRPHYRFKLEHVDSSWNDMVRGHCSYNGMHLSDPIVVREDGTLPYMLPSVIDDADMGITHIIRGEDHVTNTGVQIQMFKALGATIPTFGHPPLLTGTDGKLSKRKGSLSLVELREEKIEPMTIACLLAKLGTPDPVQIFTTLDELAQSFDLSRFGRAQPRFNPEDLDKLNALLIRKLPYETVKGRYPGVSEDLWDAVHPNIDTLSDLSYWKDVCEKPDVFGTDNPDLCMAAADLLPEDMSWQAWTKAVSEKTGVTGKNLYKPLRQCLTGRDTGPEMKALLPLLPRGTVLLRLRGK